MTNKSTMLLEHNLKQLKLPTLLREYDKLASQCASEGADHPDYLLRLSELELIDRHHRMVERRIKAARFPTTKSLDTFADRGQGRTASAQPAEKARTTQASDHRRTGLRALVQDWRRAALRGVQPALRAWIGPGDLQPALRRVDRGVRL